MEVVGRKLVLEEIVPAYRSDVLFQNLLEGNTAGFTPEFIQGYRPFGIVCEPADIVNVGFNVLMFADSLRARITSGVIPSFELIDKVYRQLRDEERFYTFLK